MKKIYALTLFILIAPFLLAQDSTKWEINLGVEASGLYQTRLLGQKNINVDEYIRRRRRQFNPLRPDGFVVSDNTNFHFGTYAGLKTNASFREKYQVHINLFFEHRGASYGANDLNNIVWFPNIFFSCQDTFRIFKQQFEIDFHAGSKPKHQIGNGLKIYNVEDQSVNFKISYKKLFLSIQSNCRSILWNRIKRFRVLSVFRRF